MTSTMGAVAHKAAEIGRGREPRHTAYPFRGRVAVTCRREAAPSCSLRWSVGMSADKILFVALPVWASCEDFAKVQALISIVDHFLIVRDGETAVATWLPVVCPSCGKKTELPVNEHDAEEITRRIRALIETPTERVSERVS